MEELIQGCLPYTCFKYKTMFATNVPEEKGEETWKMQENKFEMRMYSKKQVRRRRRHSKKHLFKNTLAGNK